MKGIKRIVSLVMTCTFALTLASSGVFNKTAKAETQMPKYLGCSEGELSDAYAYKNKVVASFYDNDQNYYFDNGVKKKLAGNIGIRMNYKEFEYETANGDYIFDIEKGQTIGKSNFLDKEALVKKKYGSQYKAIVPSCPHGNNDNGVWYYYEANNGKIYKGGVITPEDKIVELEDGEQYVNDVIYGDNYYVPIFKASGTDPYKGEEYLKVINKSGAVKRYDLDKSLKGKYGIVNVKASNNILYLDLVNESNYSDNYYYKMNVSGNVLTKGEKMFDMNSCHQDIKGNFWKVASGYVYKFEGNAWVKKYQVDPRMSSIRDIYDDNNMILTGCIQGETYKYIYTIINSNAYNTNPTNPPPPTNNSGVVIGKVSNGVLPVTVNKINKDAVNVIDASNSGTASKVEVTIASGKLIKDGKGSLQIKAGQREVMNLPFSVIASNQIKDISKVVIDISEVDGTALVKGLKAVKKAFVFELTIIDGNIKTSVHKFAKGVGEITLNLNDTDLNGLNKSKLKVLYYNEQTKKFEPLETKVVGDKVTFKTPHLSKFVVAEN